MQIKDGTDYIPQVRQLIWEYTRILNRDLTFQDLEAELADPAKKYTGSEGKILIAFQDDVAIGMVAYHRHNDERCEMKRLYVKPSARGLHLGGKLVADIIEHAKTAGYKEMVLDTLTPMQAAIHLYKKYGFEECEPYYANPMQDVIYMRKQL